MSQGGRGLSREISRVSRLLLLALGFQDCVETNSAGVPGINMRGTVVLGCENEVLTANPPRRHTHRAQLKWAKMPAFLAWESGHFLRFLPTSHVPFTWVGLQPL